MRSDFDVVVIGSGAGGAPLAVRLARAGKSVLVTWCTMWRSHGAIFTPAAVAACCTRA